MSVLKSLAKGVVGFVIGSIVLTQIASVVTGYGDARAEAAKIRNELAGLVQTSAVGLNQSLTLTINDALPHAQVRQRCNTESLPATVVPNQVQVCADAALGEVLEEQEEGNAFRKLGAEGRALGVRLRYQLEEDDPASQWDAVVSGFREVSLLGSSDWCNEERVRLVDALSDPVDGSPASDRPMVLDERVYAAAVRLGRADEALNELGLEPDDPMTVREALIGQPTVTVRCDKEGEVRTRFVVAAAAVRQALVSESEVIAVAIQDVNVEGVNDKGSDVWFSLWTWPFFIALMLGIVAWVVVQRLPDREPPPQKVMIVPTPPSPPPPGDLVEGGRSS